MIIDEKLSKYIDDKIDEKIENLDEIAFAMVYTSAALVYMLTTIYNNYLSSMARACKAYAGSAKTVCNLKYKISINEKMAKKAKELLNTKCNKAKDASRCRAEMKRKIKYYEDNIKNLKQDLKDLKNYSLK